MISMDPFHKSLLVRSLPFNFRVQGQKLPTSAFELFFIYNDTIIIFNHCYSHLITWDR